MKRFTQPRLLFSVFLLIYLATRIWCISHKNRISFDDVATLITISGNGLYLSDETKALFAKKQWISASQLHELYSRNTPFYPEGVSQILISRDIHPPLYFWIAHVWCSVFGFTSTALLSLQFFFEVLLLLLLAQFISRIGFKNPMLVGLSLFATITHLSITESFVIHRHYHLLAILALGFHLVYVYDRKPSKPVYRTAILAILVLLGLLTHFYFPVWVFAHVLAKLLAKRQWRAVLFDSLVFLGIFGLVFWWFNDFFLQMLDGRKSFEHNDSQYLTYVLGAPLRMFIPRSVLESLPFVVIALVWPIIIFTALKLRKSLHFLTKVSALSVCIFLLIICLLLAFSKVPIHSFTENRYYALIIAVLLPIVFSALEQTATPKRSKILSLVLFSSLVLQSFYYFRLKPITHIQSKKVVLVSHLVSEIYQVATILKEGQNLLTIPLPEELRPHDLSNSTLLWPAANFEDEAENALRTTHGINGAPQSFVHQGWELTEKKP